MYKTLKNIVLAGVMSAVGSGCVVTPGAMTYGAHLTNPGNAHIANAHGFAVLGDQGDRLAKAKENNYGNDRGANNKKNFDPERRTKEYYEKRFSYMKDWSYERRLNFVEGFEEEISKLPLNEYVAADIAWAKATAEECRKQLQKSNK